MSTPELAAAAGVVLRDVTWRATYVAVTSQPQGVPTPVAQFSAPPHAPMLDQQQRTPEGPPGPCFRCGMFGHWARECASGPPQQQWQQPLRQQPLQQHHQAVLLTIATLQPMHGVVVQQGRHSVASYLPPSPYGGGFATVGAETTYTAYSIGRTYHVFGLPPHPYSRCSQMHWSLEPCLAWAHGQPQHPQLQRQPQPVS